MKKLILIMIVITTTSCSEPPITADTARQECKSYNVKCFAIKDPLPDVNINIIGSDVQEKCGGNYLGCIRGDDIYMWDDDWQVRNHELCHAYCKPGTHIGPKNRFTD
jgi:hypothetical protein